MTRRSASEIVDEELREAIRDRGIDPVREQDATRKLIKEVLTTYNDRAVQGVVPLLADVAGTEQQLFDAVAGLGPLQRFLDDPEVEEIWINGPGRVFIARHGRSELTNVMLTQEQIPELCERMLKTSGRRVDLSTPFVDASLPDGSRLHIVIPDITREQWAVNIRKFVLRAQMLDELVELGSLTQHAAQFLEAAVTAGLNIVVAGGTQAGKTTLLTCLANSIPGAERVISCEEVFELKLTLRDWVPMQTRQQNLEGKGSIELRRLVTEALRMRPSRIIVGEVRQAECLDLLIALNSGLPGMCSIHANSAREAVTKLCTLPLLAGDNISSDFVVPTVAGSVDIVVHAQTTATGKRRINEIVALGGRVENSVIETSDIFTTRGGRLVRGDGYPPHMERFQAVGIDVRALLSGEQMRRSVPHSATSHTQEIHTLRDEQLSEWNAQVQTHTPQQPPASPVAASTPSVSPATAPPAPASPATAPPAPSPVMEQKLSDVETMMQPSPAPMPGWQSVLSDPDDDQATIMTASFSDAPVTGAGSGTPGSGLPGPYPPRPRSVTPGSELPSPTSAFPTSSHTASVDQPVSASHHSDDVERKPSPFPHTHQEK